MRKKKISHPSFFEAFKFWLLLGFISFGGPSGQISIMYHELVEKRKWISDARFLHALNYCMLLPGPEATQLAIYVGWLLHRIWGGIAAGILFVLPSVILLWFFSFVYVEYGELPSIAGIFYGLKPAVVAIIFAAVIQMGGKALKNWMVRFVALLAFISIFFFDLPFPLVIFSAALIGWIGYKLGIHRFNFEERVLQEIESHQAVIHDDAGPPPHAILSLSRSLKVIFISLSLWWIPLFAIGYFTGWANILFQEALFFSKAAMITFGGAYAALGFTAQHAVHHGWILPGQMIDGLGLAETTPGPLIIVLQFVGFIGAWNLAHQMDPLLSATIGALITVWATFVPCFLWIFLGAPFIEKFRSHKSLSATLSTVTSAIVGVVLNLAVWFGIQVIFMQKGGFDLIACLIAITAFFAMWKWKIGIVSIVICSGIFGLLYSVFIG